MKVLIADDDAIVREGLKMIITSQEDMCVCGEAEDGKAGLALARELRPDIALLDIRMPECDGITAAENMLAEELCAPLLLTTFDEEDFILRALKSEICGYILKNSPAERILGAIRAVKAGGTVFQEDILKYVREKISPTNGGEIFAELTPRETEVVRLVAEGLSNQQIAERLFLSNGTVRNHISAILEKTGLEHRTQIAVMWLKNI
ncbi:MAG: response regulator transcription factor [Ruminococcaceae bacterium]|nr:response regulator transcription factor [Oscillospiraceae bacterium]